MGMNRKWNMRVFEFHDNAINNTIRELNQYYIPKPENNLNQVIIELSTNYLETKREKNQYKKFK